MLKDQVKRWVKIIYSVVLLVLISFHYRRSDGRNIISPLELSLASGARHWQSSVLRWALCSGPPSFPDLHPPSRALLPTPTVLPSLPKIRLLAGTASPTPGRRQRSGISLGIRGASSSGAGPVISGASLSQQHNATEAKTPSCQTSPGANLNPTFGFFHSLNPPFISGSSSSPCLLLYLEACLYLLIRLLVLTVIQPPLGQC